LKSLVIYYSLEGSCEFLANIISEKHKSDILKLKPENKRRSIAVEKLKTVKRILFKSKPRLQKNNINPNEYDVLFIGTPVRGKSFCPELHSFFNLHRIKNKKIVLFCSCGSNRGHVFEHIQKALPGNKILGEKAFSEPLKNDPEKAKEEMLHWLSEITDNLLHL